MKYEIRPEKRDGREGHLITLTHDGIENVEWLPSSAEAQAYMKGFRATHRLIFGEPEEQHN